MGLKYYLNLIKKESDIETVKLRYFINVFLFVSYMILIFVCLSLRDANALLSGVCGMVGLLSVLLFHIANYRFNKFLISIIKNECLDENDKTDAAFIVYRKGFIESKRQYRIVNKIFFIIQVVLSALYIAALQLIIVLNITGNLDLSNQIFRVVVTMMWVFIALLIVFGFFMGAKNGVWYQNYIKELDIIKTYKAKQQEIDGRPIRKKYKITEDKKPKEQFKYLFTEKSLYKRFAKFQKIGSIGGLVLGGILGLSLVSLTVILEAFGLSKADAEFFSGIGLAGMFSITIIFVAWNIYATSRVRNIQYKLLKENGVENHLYIKLHELRKPFNKRWGITFPLGVIGAIVSNIAFAGIVATLAKTDAYGWIFFLLIIVEIIALIVVYFKAFGKLRFRMIAIEKEIDKQRETKWQESQTAQN